MMTQKEVGGVKAANSRVSRRDEQRISSEVAPYSRWKTKLPRRSSGLNINSLLKFDVGNCSGRERRVPEGASRDLDSRARPKDKGTKRRKNTRFSREGENI